MIEPATPGEPLAAPPESAPPAAAPPAAAGRRRPPAALLALLAYALLAAWQLRDVMTVDRVLSPSAFVVRGGPFEPGWGELTGSGIDLLADNARQFTPWLLYAARHLQADGELPLWKSTASCGAPLVGNGQSALFFPTRLLAVLLGAPSWIHAAMAWLRLIVAAFGAFLLLRHLRASPLSAWVGGFVFGFGGFLMVFRFHPHADVVALLPWLVLAGDRLALRPGARGIAAVALVAGLQWLAGHPQTAVQCQLAASALVAVRAWSRRREPRGLLAPLLALGVALLLGLAIAAIQLVPLIEYTRLSETALMRAARQSGGSWPAWWDVAVFVLALALAAVGLAWLARGRRVLLATVLLFAGVALGLFGGVASGLSGAFILPLCADWFGDATRFMGPLNYVEGNGAWVGAALVLAAAGLLLSRERGAAKVAGVLAVVGLLAGLRAPVLIAALGSLPVIGLADNGRLVLLALLGLAVLAGLGLDALREATSAARLRLGAAVLAPVLAAFGVLVLAVQGGTVRSNDVPGGAAAPMNVARFGLLDSRFAEAVLALEAREPTRNRQFALPSGDDSLEVLGFAATREPLRSAQVVYSSRNALAPSRWSRADDIASLLGEDIPVLGPEWHRYVFRAAIPRADVPPERVPVQIRVVTSSQQALSSDALLSLEPSSSGPLLFPARPAPAPAQGELQLELLGAGLLLALIACGARGRAAQVLPWLLVGVAVVSLLPFGATLAPSVPADLFFPPSGEFETARAVLPQQRVVGMNTYALGAEVLTAYDLPDARGYDALAPPRVSLLLRAALDWPDRMTSLELLPSRTDPDLRVLGLMAVSELLDWALPPPDARLLQWPGIRRLLPNMRVPIVVNAQALPRARLVARAVVEPDDAAALARLRDPAFDLVHACVLADAAGAPPELLVVPDTAQSDAAPPPVAVNFAEDLPNRIRLEIAPAAPALLLLADTEFPGWSAWVDGIERPILRANVAFRAVAVAPGDRVVEFRYEPGSFALGRAITLAALAICALLALRRPR